MENSCKCPNCGADITMDVVSCPFCGYINPIGAEKEYMGKLEEVRESLDVVDDEAIEDYKKTMARPVKVIIAVIMVALVILVISVVIIRVKNTRKVDASLHTGETTLEEMKWQKENFALFNDMYEKGEYDKLTDAIDNIIKEHSIYEWEHAVFYEYYSIYKDTKESIEEVDRRGWSESTAGLVTYDCMRYYYCMEEETMLNEEEKENLKPCADYMLEITKNRLGYDEEALEEMREIVLHESGYLIYFKVRSIAKENMKKYK